MGAYVIIVVVLVGFRVAVFSSDGQTDLHLYRQSEQKGVKIAVRSYRSLGW